MYAVIRAGGKQYRVSPGDVLRLERLTPDDNGQVRFPVLAVSASQGRGDKILVFHYKRKKQYKKLQGHRQAFSAVRITEIAVDGQRFTAPEVAAKPEKPPKAPSTEPGGAAPEEAVAPKKSKSGSKAAKRGSAAGAGSKTASQYAGTSKATASKSKGGSRPKPKK